MSWFRTYILSVCAAGVLTALLYHVEIHKTIKKILHFSCCILLLITVIWPIVHLEAREIQHIVSDLLPVDTAPEIPEMNQEQLMLKLISERCREYILDKANTLHMDVAVTVETHMIANCPSVTGIRITGHYTDQQKQQMTAVLEQDLGIPGTKQEWVMTNGRISE